MTNFNNPEKEIIIRIQKIDDKLVYNISDNVAKIHYGSAMFKGDMSENMDFNMMKESVISVIKLIDFNKLNNRF